MTKVKINSKVAMLVVMFAMALAFNACSNDGTGGDSSDSQGGSNQSSDSQGSSNRSSDSQGSGDPVTKLELPDKMQAVIGYGYDASKRYASSIDIKFPILNQDALLAANRIVKDVNMVFGEFNTITGADINQYRRELAKKVSVSTSGGFGPISFGAEVSNNFGEDRIQNSSYIFATTSINIGKSAYNIQNRTGLDAFFTDEFKTDLNNPAITATNTEPT